MNASFHTSEDSKTICPACAHEGVTLFYSLPSIPAHSCKLMESVNEAINYPKRDLILGLCKKCGLVHNTLFDQSAHEYNTSYEETQGFSPTFSEHSNQLIEEIIKKFKLHHKTVLEIGCGKGEFLYNLCKSGNNQGIGIDPSYVPDRLPEDSADHVTFIQDFYQLEHGNLKPDFIFCRHTLEHIHDVRNFMQLIKSSMDGRAVDVWFDLPDAHRIWREGAFWDIYYEHASYFTLGSTARLFRNAGFNVTDLKREYGDQWISIGSASGVSTNIKHGLEDSVDDISQDIMAFQKQASLKIAYWKRKLEQVSNAGGRAILWGGGSKAVAFISTLGLTEEVHAVVDINPYKAGKFLPASGHPVISPSDLKALSPNFVVVMNPIYTDEIEESLKAMGIQAEVEACQ